MAHKVNLQSDKSINLLLLSAISILILLVTTDIYLSVLSPASYGLLSTSSQTFCSGRKTFEGDSSALGDKIIGIGEKGRDGIVFLEIQALKNMNATGDENWDDLFAGDGYLYLQPENSSFPKEPWGVSMFHGLHCLQLLRSKIQALEGAISGVKPLDRRSQNGHHHHGSDDSDPSDVHYLHCFSYLAQSIACSADDTLEPPHINYFRNGSFSSYNIDGIGTWHQCRDQSLMRQKMIESQERLLERWDYRVGDTVQSIWGGAER